MSGTKSHGVEATDPSKHLLSEVACQNYLNDNISTSDTRTATLIFKDSDVAGEISAKSLDSLPPRGRGSQWSFLDTSEFDSKKSASPLVPPLDPTITSRLFPTPEQMAKMDEES